MSPAAWSDATLCSVQARLPRLLRTHLAALGGSTPSRGEAGPLGALPPPRLLEAASSRVADSTAFVLLSTPGTFSSLATVTGVSSVTTGVNSYFKSWFG